MRTGSAAADARLTAAADPYTDEVFWTAGARARPLGAGGLVAAADPATHAALLGMSERQRHTTESFR